MKKNLSSRQRREVIVARKRAKGTLRDHSPAKVHPMTEEQWLASQQPPKSFITGAEQSDDVVTVVGPFQKTSEKTKNRPYK